MIALQVPNSLQENIPLLLLEEDKQRSLHTAYHGFSFRVLHFPVMVESLGLHNSVLRTLKQMSSSAQIKVELSERGSQEIVYHTSFNISDITRKTDGYFYNIKNSHVPLESFDGTLGLKVILNNSNEPIELPQKCSIAYTEEFGRVGLVHINGLLLQNSSILQFTKYSCPLVSLQYSILDPDGLKRLHRSKKHLIEMEMMKNKEQRRTANQETEEYNDVVFLSMVDASDTVSEKFKLFSKHAIDDFDFDNLLIVDDETFVFLDNVIEKLESKMKPNLWWSSFSHYPRTWSPKESLYPSFPVPIPSAMTLSKRLVQYIAHNTNYLKTFSSFSYSLGIWFAAIDTNILNDKNWSARILTNISAFKTDDRYLALQNISPKLMRQIWEKSQKTDNY